MRFSLVGVGVLVAMSSVLSACSTLSDYYRRPTDYEQMPKRSVDGTAVATLSLDASRRLVIAQEPAPGSGLARFTCPEPPPDVALNILAQSLVSFKAKGGTEAEMGSSFEAVAQMLANRTSTVEFWRTTSSMYCVLLMNNKPAEARAYLEAAKVTAGLTKDTAATAAAAVAFRSTSVFERLAEAKEKAGKEQEEANTANEEVAKTEAEAKAVADAARTACALVPEDQKATNGDCIKAAEADTAGVSSG